MDGTIRYVVHYHRHGYYLCGAVLFLCGRMILIIEIVILICEVLLAWFILGLVAELRQLVQQVRAGFEDVEALLRRRLS